MAQPVTQGGIDYPDGGFSSGKGVFPITGDLAEACVRLGSPDTHNREGNVIFMETFEHGVATWNPTGYGTGGEVITSAARQRSRGYSAKLVAGSDGSKAAKIFRKFPIPALGLYGLEFSWLPEAHTDELEWRLAYHDGTNEHLYACKYRTVENDVQIKDEDGNWQTVITGLELDYSYVSFQTTKIVADLENDLFVRLIINESEHDLSAYPTYEFVTADSPNVRVGILLWGDAGYNGYSFIDDIILTQNEPTR